MRDLFFFFFSWGIWTLSCGMWDLVLDQGLNPGSLHWEHRVLATAPPGKSQDPQNLAPTIIYFSFHCSHVCIIFSAIGFQPPWFNKCLALHLEHPIPTSISFWKLLPSCKTQLKFYIRASPNVPSPPSSPYGIFIHSISRSLLKSKHVPGSRENTGDTGPHGTEPSWSLQSSRFMSLNPCITWLMPFSWHWPCRSYFCVCPVFSLKL